MFKHCTGPLNVADEYCPEPIIRAKNWAGLYGNRECGGRVLRGICVYGLPDAAWLAGRRELFANKFQLTFDYPLLDCLEERHRNRTRDRRPGPDFHESFYRRLPTVVYGRKNGDPGLSSPPQPESKSKPDSHRWLLDLTRLEVFDMSYHHNNVTKPRLHCSVLQL